MGIVVYRKKKMIFSKACLMVVAATMASSAYAELGEPGTRIAGGVVLSTDVRTELNRDLIQKALEDIVGDEMCSSLTAGKLEYDSSDYFRNIPHYTATEGDELRLYKAYYGDDSFLESFVDAAFSNGKVMFKNNEHDFSKLPGDTDGSGDCVGREEAVKKVTSYTGSYIDMVQYMEEALEAMRNGCNWGQELYNCPSDFVKGDVCPENPSPCKDAVHAWEKAIATFSGSIEGSHGKTLKSPGSYGKWLMALAGKRCANFKTCGVDEDGTNKGVPARVNTDVLVQFMAGQEAVFYGRLSETKTIMSEIIKDINVSRIQGVLRYAYRTGRNKSLKDKEIAEGAAFAFGLLPQIWACNKKSALIVAANTDIGSDRTSQLNDKEVSFQNVRSALECNYDCLGIRFDDVGELNDCVDDNGDKTLCFAGKTDSPNICKTTKDEKKFRKKCKNSAPPQNKNKAFTKTRFGTITIKKF